MKTIYKTITSSIILATAFFSPYSLANQINLSAYTIPASACIPANPIDSDKLKLSHGSYVFASGETGSASLLCPLSLSGWKAGVSILDQNYLDPFISMSKYRVYYRDPNDCSSATGVEVRLRYRNKTGLIALNPKWHSWQDSDSPNTICYMGVTKNTTQEVTFSHNLKTDRLYHFLVKIKRLNTAQKPAFSGIDFPYKYNVEG